MTDPNRRPRRALRLPIAVLALAILVAGASQVVGRASNPPSPH